MKKGEKMTPEQKAKCAEGGRQKGINHQKRLEAAKQRALENKGNSYITYTDPVLMARRLAEYFRDCDSKIDDKGNSKPFTLKGMTLALRLNPSTYTAYQMGDYDYIVEDGTETSVDILTLPDDIIQYMEQLLSIPDIKAHDPGDLIKRCKTVYFSAVLDNAKLIFDDQRESSLYSRNYTTDIFSAKNHLGMKDEQTILTKSQSYSKEEAAKMISMYRDAERLTFGN